MKIERKENKQQSKASNIRVKLKQLKTYPNMRSIHSCKWADTYSLSRAFLCLWIKSTGFSAQAGSFTVSDKAEVSY